MPKSNNKPRPDADNDAQVKELFARAEKLFDSAARFAFLNNKHSPSPEDVARLKQRLSLHLLEDDFRRLRSYDHRAKLETWLQAVANREASRFLRQENRHFSLDDAPPGIFLQPPTQEVLLLNKEQRRLLEKVLPKLAPRQRQIFDDWQQGVAAEKTAQGMNTKVATVHRQRQRVLQKIRELIQKEQK